MTDVLSPRGPLPEAVERKRLRELARPFTKDIMKWQARLAFHRTSRSAATSIEDAVTAGAGLGDLLMEVQEAQQRFIEVIRGEPIEGAIQDASRAFERLIEQISSELR